MLRLRASTVGCSSLFVLMLLIGYLRCSVFSPPLNVRMRYPRKLPLSLRSAVLFYADISKTISSIAELPLMDHSPQIQTTMYAIYSSLHVVCQNEIGIIIIIFMIIIMIIMIMP